MLLASGVDSERRTVQASGPSLPFPERTFPVNNDALRRVLSLWSPLLLGLATLCSESPTGPTNVEPGTFQLSVTGEAAVDEQIYGRGTRSVARVDSTPEGVPVFRHRVRLADADTGLELDLLFFSVGSAVDTMPLGPADSAALAGGLEPGAAVAGLRAGSLAEGEAAVEEGTLMIVSESETEIGGRLRLRATVGDSLRRSGLHLDGRFRAARADDGGGI